MSGGEEKEKDKSKSTTATNMLSPADLAIRKEMEREYKERSNNMTVTPTAITRRDSSSRKKKGATASAEKETVVVYGPQLPSSGALNVKVTQIPSNEMLEIANGLTRSEAIEELLECSRYGELDPVLALLKVFSDKTFVNETDDNGNTALHQACANGHLEVVKLLLQHNASYKANTNGNTPLHWAAAQGHLHVVQPLLKHFSPKVSDSTQVSGALDVLEKNAFGKSCLTEAFGSQKTDLIKYMLEHSTATEERLISGANGKEIDLEKEVETSAKHKKVDGSFTNTSTSPPSSSSPSTKEGEEKETNEEATKTLESEWDVEESHRATEEHKLCDEDMEKQGPWIGQTNAYFDTTTASPKKDEQASSSTSNNDVKDEVDEKLAQYGIIHEFDFTMTNDKDTEEKKQQTNEETKTPTTPTDAVTEEEKKEQQQQSCVSPLRIRELPILHPDDPFGQTAQEDTTGYAIWCASLVMSRWMVDLRQRFSSKKILEVGSGCGVPGLTIAKYTDAESVYVTDLNPTTIQNLQYNVSLNTPFETTVVKAQTIDWNDESTWPRDDNNTIQTFDVVVGADLIYQKSILPLLKKVVLGLMKPCASTFYYVCPDTNRDGLMEFLKDLKQLSSVKGKGHWVLKNESVAPDSYKQNPLKNQDTEECFLHFHELFTQTYMLYEFAWVP